MTTKILEDTNNIHHMPLYCNLCIYIYHGSVAFLEAVSGHLAELWMNKGTIGLRVCRLMFNYVQLIPDLYRARIPSNELLTL